jgi:Flp pilus assembly pilin Flp
VKGIKKFLKRLWQEESAQGATEYILLLVVVVAVVMMFSDQIKEAVNGKLAELKEGISGVK